MNRLIHFLILSSAILTFSANPLLASNQNDFQNLDKEANIYIGIGIGWMKLKDDLTKEFFQTYPLVLNGGYIFHKYFSVEGRYTRSVLNVSYDNGTLTSSQDDSDYPTELTNLGIYLKPTYPINDFNVYTLLGYGEVSLNDIKGADRIEWGFQWGVGLSYKLNNNFKLFGDYLNLYEGKGFNGRAKQANVHVDTLNMGVSYEF